MQPVVVGEEEAVLGFSLIGVEGRIAVDAEGAARELRRLVDSDEPLIVFLTETVAQWIRPEVAAAAAHGAAILVIAGVRTPADREGRDPEAELLSALGVKI